MKFETYAHSFQVFPRLGLERITALLAHLGNPQNACRCIHIAGTNGKGSVSFALASVLLAQGEKVGLYTSPNLTTSITALQHPSVFQICLKSRVSYPHSIIIIALSCCLN